MSSTKVEAPSEDDASSASSSSSEVFDNNTRRSASQNNWKLDTNGHWLRFGSTESATSTGLSSMCSSVATNDKQVFLKDDSLLSKKRMADGTIKRNAIRVSSNFSTPSLPTNTMNHANPAIAKDPSIPKKRRGRPPKQKEPAVHYSLKARRASEVFSSSSDVKPRSSIPSRLPVEKYARQCIDAAYASRLDPFELHPAENALLEKDIMSSEVTIYLNIRNAILRLWTQNPIVSVTAEEAAGCAKEARFFGLAQVAYQWLVRNGYINFGCVEVPKNPKTLQEAKKHTKQRTIVVVGAGVSGLTTARQLESLIAQAADQWHNNAEKPPRVIVLEGRKRIGGRVYSKPLVSQLKKSLPGDLRNTAEMGAMIVTGFERGNPLNAVIRAQLGLHYHMMTDTLTIYDTDGNAVDEEKDNMITELYTDITDRAGEFRAQPQKHTTMIGDKELIGRCRDPIPNGFATFQLEPQFNPEDNLSQHKPTFKRGRRRNAPPGTEKLTGRSQVVENSSVSTTGSAARAALQMGFELQDGVSSKATVSLKHTVSGMQHPSLGSVMNEAIEQYQEIIEMTPQDMRLLNWHHANLEYANAAPVSWLSLSGHDQDNGNEFEGAHSEIIGGYTQVPRGLMNLPTKLDVRFDQSVDSIHYDVGTEDDSDVTTKVVTTDGMVFEADEVVLTTSLGVLKSDMIDFDPPLPGWKYNAIDRLGFGLLNKVVLLYDVPFWDDSRDMFGLLNEAEQKNSLDPAHYERSRGRFYLIWNCSKTSGRPMLIALLAGHAAYDAETTSTQTLMHEVTDRLRKTFPDKDVPEPREVIVTRWKSDRFTRGTYSFVGTKTQAEDYDLMSRSVGNLHFAGEATCGTHPATVHGAFLSGLRVAAEVMNIMAGDLSVPRPLVQAAPDKPTAVYPLHSQAVAPTCSSDIPEVPVGLKIESNEQETPSLTTETAALTVDPSSKIAQLMWPSPHKKTGPPRQSVVATDPTFWMTTSSDQSDRNYEMAIANAIASKIGQRPIKPKRPGVNPFLLYTNIAMEDAKVAVAGADRRGSSSGGGKTGRNAIRTLLGERWRALDERGKLPYQQEAQRRQEEADRARKEYDIALAQWEQDAAEIREEFRRDNPRSSLRNSSTIGAQDVVAGHTTVGSDLSPMGGRRRTNVSTNVALDLRL
ncbi:hypothetical protein K431DRAFT_283071 [Polychaeton citri CBS 116435]|uniref:SWIRM domain-containing protein n=1 Tax=Polychaeton citri CBS 116435 TaxID=1314669 RepID=A0A9P4UPB0_9PEZI|nr:hypothetical protein K431DRAFT_283071 [Polychaeton citri CBS 116435]